VEEYQGLQEWFQMETEKYTAMMKHRHTAEIEAFTEQLRLKDEKLEAFRWRAVSMDVEASRLRCRIQELEARLAQQEKHGAGLEALLLDRENESRALKEHLEALQAQAICVPAGDADTDAGDRWIPCSPVKIQRTVSGEAEKLSSGSSRHEEGTDDVSKFHRAETKVDELVSPDDDKDPKAFDLEATEALAVPVRLLACAAAATTWTEHERRHDAPPRQSFRSEIEEEKEVHTDPGNAKAQASTSSSQESQEVTSELALVVAPPAPGQSSAWKTDIHALAVSYKIKRLKQQLLVLEKLAAEGKEAPAASRSSGSEASCSSRQHPRTRYQTMVSFLGKHIKRYQSLDDKIDDLCARMVRETNPNSRCIISRIVVSASSPAGDQCVYGEKLIVCMWLFQEESKRSVGRERRHGAPGEQSAALGQFLEETFQLQRFMVATGQKLLETQSRIAPGLVSRGGAGEDDAGVDMKRLMDVAGALLRDVQRGLEVRIARIIGDLEGTLTFHGILRTTR
jgi:uncharacterized coiled-coil protein SlyX